MIKDKLMREWVDDGQEKSIQERESKLQLKTWIQNLW